MSSLAYKLNFLGSQSIEGDAERVVFKDPSLILTVQRGHAPLISVIKNGICSVVSGGETSDYPYESGLLRISSAGCTVTILS